MMVKTEQHFPLCVCMSHIVFFAAGKRQFLLGARASCNQGEAWQINQLADVIDYNQLDALVLAHMLVDKYQEITEQMLPQIHFK